MTEIDRQILIDDVKKANFTIEEEKFIMKNSRRPKRITAEETHTVIIHAVPKSVHREFKSLCARKDKTMQESFIELLRAAIIKPQNKK